jgi:hypothetical protein
MYALNYLFRKERRMINAPIEPKWWDGELYEYNLESLVRDILEIKEKRNGKVLSSDSYDFIVFLSNQAGITVTP